MQIIGTINTRAFYNLQPHNGERTCTLNKARKRVYGQRSRWVCTNVQKSHINHYTLSLSLSLSIGLYLSLSLYSQEEASLFGIKHRWIAHNRLWYIWNWLSVVQNSSYGINTTFSYSCIQRTVCSIWTKICE